MKLDIALAIGCRTEDLRELNLETSLKVETGVATWQLELEEIMVHRARQAARSLAKQLSPNLEPPVTPDEFDFLPLGEALDAGIGRRKKS